MPANKRQQDREAKRGELVAAARHLFIGNGYENTSMATLAKAAGVAGNTIYWYFADKDAVLLAVLDDVLTEALGDYGRVATEPLEDQLVWVVRQLQQMQRLVNTVHARAAHSAAVDEWHNGFHAITEGMFRETLVRAGVDHAGIDVEVKIGVFAVEGLLTHGLDDEQQQAICRRLAEQWTRS